MAATLTQKNPRLIKSDNPIEKQFVLAGNAATWKQGQPGTYSSGVAVVVADDGTSAQFVFLSDRDAAETATYTWVGLLTADQVWEGFEYDGTVDQTDINVSYACEVTSNIFTVDVDDTGNDLVKIVDLAYLYEPERNKSDDIKARVRFKYLTAAIEA